MRLYVPPSSLALALLCVSVFAPCSAANAPISTGENDTLIDLGSGRTSPAAAETPRPSEVKPAPTPSSDPAELYRSGCDRLRAHGVDRDEKEGFRLITAAAQAGFPDAQALLGRLYRDGVGTEKNYFEAIRCFRLAFDAGLADGAIGLGLLYFEGKGVHRDLVEAAALLSYASPTILVAPPEAYPEARKALDALPGMLGPIEQNQVRERIGEERDRTLRRLMDAGKGAETGTGQPH